VTTLAREEVNVVDLVAAIRRQSPSQVQPDTDPGPTWGPDTVGVVGAHPGAGATAVAVALVDVLARCGRPATLVDLAPAPDAFTAAECEVDSGNAAWRAGRRGEAQLLRRRGPAADAVPATGPTCPTVVDGAQGPLGREVLVCRPTLPSVRRAEPVSGRATLVAVVGAARWPKPVAASLGPSLAAASRSGRMVFVPHSRHLEVNGVDAEPTPPHVVAAVGRLAELLWGDLDGAPSRPRWRGLRR
jgi:hypothetical protein